MKPIIEFGCPDCDKIWQHDLKNCPLCSQPLVSSEVKRLRVENCVRVDIPSEEHEEVPYYVLELKSPSGQLHYRKTFESKEAGETYD